MNKIIQLILKLNPILLLILKIFHKMKFFKINIPTNKINIINNKINIYIIINYQIVKAQKKL